MKKVGRVVKFNEYAWLKPYIDMNTDLRKKKKMILKKTFLKLMNNAVFGKTLEKIRKYRYIKLAKRERRRNCLVSEQNYHATAFFIEHLLEVEMKKTDTFNTRIK